MILFNASNVPTKSPFEEKLFNFSGDGKQEVIMIDLSVAPLAMRFEGDHYPRAVTIEDGADVEATISRNFLSFKFFVAPKETPQMVRVRFWYEGHA